MDFRKSENAGTKRVQVDERVEGNTSKFHQETLYGGQFKNGETEPSVQDVNVFVCGTTVVTITNFKNGQNSQTVRILGDPNTTIAHNSNISTNTGANKVLTADIIYTFTRVNNKWYEAE